MTLAPLARNEAACSRASSRPPATCGAAPIARLPSTWAACLLGGSRHSCRPAASSPRGPSRWGSACGKTPAARATAVVVTPPRGDFVIFPTSEHPVHGKNGYYRAGMRHGVSTVTSGERTALGVVFHDAK